MFGSLLTLQVVKNRHNLQLSRIRELFPNVTSVLMDEAVLLSHRAQCSTESAPIRTSLAGLTPAEASLCRDLVEGRFGRAVRLEQERISHAMVNDTVTESL